MITPCFYSFICIKLIYESVADMPYEERPFMLMLSIVPKVSSLIIFIHFPQTLWRCDRDVLLDQILCTNCHEM